METLSNKKIAEKNELETLLAIGQIGWLSATQIANWVWHESASHSARVCADKCIKRLLKKELILQRSCALKMSVFVLTKAGAEYANEHNKVKSGLTTSVELFRNGYSLSTHDCERQKHVVEYLSEAQKNGKTVYGPAAIRRAIELQFLSKNLSNADGYVYDEKTDEAYAVLLVRNRHEMLIDKARRLRHAAGKIKLLGSEGLVKFFKQKLSH